MWWCAVIEESTGEQRSPEAEAAKFCMWRIRKLPKGSNSNSRYYLYTLCLLSHPQGFTSEDRIKPNFFPFCGRKGYRTPGSRGLLPASLASGHSLLDFPFGHTQFSCFQAAISAANVLQNTPAPPPSTWPNHTQLWYYFYWQACPDCLRPH